MQPSGNRRVRWFSCATLLALIGCGDCSGATNTGTPRTEALSQAAAPASPSAEACRECEQRSCRDYKHAHVDLVAGCFEDADGAKVKSCTQAVECGHRTGCAYGKRGPEQCYCGAAEAEDCAKGVGVNGPCKAELEAAATKNDVEWVTTHFGDRSLALGNAVLLLKCERDLCKQECSP
jgi:hypothetical protein